MHYPYSSRTPSHPPLPDERPDADLVRAAADGERSAFLEIVHRYQSLVCAVAFSVVRRLEVSEEVAQEVFVTLWKQLHTLREPEKLRAWLKVCAHTRAIDALRRERPSLAELPPEELDAVLESLTDARRTPDEAACHADECSAVWAALDALPESLRLPIILYYREGESAAEVARQLDMEEDAVRQRLSRGRAMLRDRLTGALERVLAESRPSGVFAFAVLAGIGALTAPGALAAAAIGGGGAATGGTTFLKAMSLSKSSIGLAAALAIVATPLGYYASAIHSAAEMPPGALQENGATSQAGSPHLQDSGLYHEWLELHRQYGAEPPNAAAMPALSDAINAMSDTFRRRAFRAALITEWVQLDPQGAMENFLSEGNYVLLEVMRQWMKQEPGAALAAFTPHLINQTFAASGLLNLIAETTPDALPAFLNAYGPHADPFVSMTADAFSLLADKNLKQALFLAEKVDGAQRHQAQAGVAAAWAKTDPQAALAWAQSLPQPRGMVFGHLLRGWAEQDPAAALAHLHLAPNRAEDAGFRAEDIVLPAAFKKDFAEALRWISEHPDKLIYFSAYAISSPFRDDPDGILTQISRASAPVRSEMLNSLMDLNHMYSDNLALVVEWARGQNAEDPFVREVMAQMESRLCETDPPAGAALLRQKPSSVLDDPAEMDRATIAFLPDGSFQNGSHLRLTDELFDQAPPQLRAALLSRALDMSEEGILPGHLAGFYQQHMNELRPADRERALTAIARTMTETHPAGAVAWLAEQAEEAAPAHSGVASAWAQTEPREASVWVQSLPQGAARDHAATGLVRAVVGDSPDDAWAWAVSIGDESLRTESTRAVVEHLSTGHAEEAHAFIHNAQLPEPEKESLLELLSTP